MSSCWWLYPFWGLMSHSSSPSSSTCVFFSQFSLCQFHLSEAKDLSPCHTQNLNLGLCPFLLSTAHLVTLPLWHLLSQLSYLCDNSPPSLWHSRPPSKSYLYDTPPPSGEVHLYDKHTFPHRFYLMTSSSPPLVQFTSMTHTPPSNPHLYLYEIWDTSLSLSLPPRSSLPLWQITDELIFFILIACFIAIVSVLYMAHFYHMLVPCFYAHVFSAVYVFLFDLKYVEKPRV